MQLQKKSFILPPPQLQAVIDKTASFIAKNGMAFQQRIMDQSEQSSKFNFLQNTDPYYNYFEYTLNLIKQGQLPPSLTESKVENKAESSKPNPPPEYKFLTHLKDMNRIDLDLIQLTAKYTALYGQSFHLKLQQKEAENYRFHFMRPTHSKHEYYQQYIKQFKYMIEHKDALNENIKNVKNDPFFILPNILKRSEYLDYLRFEQTNKEEKQDVMRQLYDSIDWHDYKLIEELNFSILDSKQEYPVPLKLNDLKTMSIQEKQRKLKHMDQLLATVEQEIQNDISEASENDENDEKSDAGSDEMSMEMSVSSKNSTKSKEMQIPSHLNIKTPKTQITPKQAPIITVCPHCNMKMSEVNLPSHLKECLKDSQHLKDLERQESKNVHFQVDDEIFAKQLGNRNKIVENKPNITWDGKQHTKKQVLEQMKQKRELDETEELTEFDVEIQLPNDGELQGNVFTMHVSKNDTIISLKKRIQEKTEIPWNKMKLFKESQLLKNAMKMSMLTEHCVIYLKL
eukprot:NODE_277_length_10928_cov_0.583987.p1 type:complete len:512 gc:universal NODE_277_length_10928_cov_0.583987:9142-7607(-)